MLITLDNGQIRVCVDTLGAQLMSVVKDGTEYLWQGDSNYWKGRAPVLFPVIGRLWKGCCCYDGKTYEMGIHGFARHLEFAVQENTAERLALSLVANADTQACYPFDFSFEIIYHLKESTLITSYHINNLGTTVMPFAVGGHPGFNVPFCEGTSFEDYYLEFTQPCYPDRIGFSDEVLVSGNDTRYELKNDRYIPLSHNLFDSDAIILKNMCREVTLRSAKTSKYLTVSYPDMPYIGFWHMPKTDAPYVCIEPWTSLPGRQDVIEDLACKSDLCRIEPGNSYQNVWTITIGGAKE